LALFNQRFNKRQIFTAHSSLVRFFASPDFESNPLAAILAVGKYHNKNLVCYYVALFRAFFPVGQLSSLKDTKNNKLQHLSICKFCKRH